MGENICLARSQRFTQLKVTGISRKTSKKPCERNNIPKRFRRRRPSTVNGCSTSIVPKINEI